MPLNIAIGPGNEHDSRRLIELVEGLEEKPRQLYADSAIRYIIYKEIPRIYRSRG